MTMTNSTYNKASHPNDDADQILHLKRLLVTLKQQYEKGWEQLNDQLQAEKGKTQTLNRSLGEIEARHEEELEALRSQLKTLREVVKQKENSSADEDLEASRQRIDQLERVIPYLREKSESSDLEVKQLQVKLDELLKESEEKERSLYDQVHNAQNEIHLLKHTLAEKESLASIDAKNFFQQSQVLEARYIEVLNEKVNLDHQVEMQHKELEEKSNQLSTLQENLNELELEKERYQSELDEKSRQLAEMMHDKDHGSERLTQQQELLNQQAEHISSLQKHVQDLEGQNQSYEAMLQGKDQRYADIVNEKVHLEHQIKQLHTDLEHQSGLMSILKEQLNAVEGQKRASETILLEREQQIEVLQKQLVHDKEAVEEALHKGRSLLEESEGRFRIAQQHLAKKVKEVTLMSEKIEQQQIAISEHLNSIHSFKNQIEQLHQIIEEHQNQEKQLQDQLHENAKSAESQVARWEEKYFQMSGKWEESQQRVNELLKIEEKYHQIQSLLGNLVPFIGNSAPQQQMIPFQPEPIVERTVLTPYFEQQASQAILEESYNSPQESHFDLFGMPYPRDRNRSTTE